MNIVFLDEYSLGGIDLSRIKQLGNYTGYEKTTPGEIAERCIDVYDFMCCMSSLSRSQLLSTSLLEVMINNSCFSSYFGMRG